MIEQELLFDLEKSFKEKFKNVEIVLIDGAYLFDTPLFKLHLGNDLEVNDHDYWEYCSRRNDLGLPTYFKCSRTLLNIYFLSDKTVDRAKKRIERFNKYDNLMDPKLAQLSIPYTIHSDFSIISFMIHEIKE